MDQQRELDIRRLKLADHGDRHERRMWPRIEKLFPSYEVFWKLYIVPLSYRTDSSIGSLHPLWYRLRPDVPKTWESLAMAHYSVFYWGARAEERLDSGPVEYREDVLVHFDSALDCLDLFVSALRGIARDSGIELSETGSRPLSKSDPVFATIRAYRNAIVHNPVLGRGVTLQADYIVTETKLHVASKSWAAAADLPQSAFVNLNELLVELCHRFFKALERIWILLLLDIADANFQRKYRAMTESLSHVAPDPDRMSEASTQSIAVSGSFFIRNFE